MPATINRFLRSYQRDGIRFLMRCVLGSQRLQQHLQPGAMIHCSSTCTLAAGLIRYHRGREGRAEQQQCRAYSSAAKQVNPPSVRGMAT